MFMFPCFISLMFKTDTLCSFLQQKEGQLCLFLRKLCGICVGALIDHTGHACFQTCSGKILVKRHSCYVIYMIFLSHIGVTYNLC